MTDQNPVLQRLMGKKQNITAMLSPWLQRSLGDSLPTARLSGTNSLDVKRVLITQKLPLVINKKSLDTGQDRYTNFDRLLHKRYQLGSEFSSVLTGFSKDQKSWGELERVFPNEAGREDSIRPQTGEMRRGTVIQRMEKLPKIGESVSGGRQTLTGRENLGTARDVKSQRAVVTPGQRLYTRVSELTNSNQEFTQERDQVEDKTDRELVDKGAPEPQQDFKGSPKPTPTETETAPNSVQEADRKGQPEAAISTSEQGNAPALPLAVLRTKPEPSHDNTVEPLPAAVPVKKSAEQVHPPKALPVVKSQQPAVQPLQKQSRPAQVVQRDLDKTSEIPKDTLRQNQASSIVQPLSPESESANEELPELLPLYSPEMTPDIKTGTEVEPHAVVPTLLETQVLKRVQDGQKLPRTDIARSTSQKPAASAQPDAKLPLVQRDKYSIKPKIAPTEGDIARDRGSIKTQEMLQTSRVPVYPTDSFRTEKLSPQKSEASDLQNHFEENLPRVISHLPSPSSLQAPAVHDEGRDKQPAQEIIHQEQQPPIKPVMDEFLPLRAERMWSRESMIEVPTQPVPPLQEPIIPQATPSHEAVLQTEHKKRHTANRESPRQRTAAPITASAAIVQRIEDKGEETGKTEPDYDRLAEEVFPYLKRLLEIERERLLGR